MARTPKPQARTTARTGRMPTPAERTTSALEQSDRADEYDRTQRLPEFFGEERGPPLTVSEMAKHLDLTPARIAGLGNEGIIPRNVDGTYPKDACRVAYIRAIRRMAASRARTGDKTTPLIETKTLKAKLELAIAQGEYVRIEDVEAVSVEADLNLRNELAGIGAHITRDLELRGKIDRAINDAIARHRNSLEAAAASAFGESESMDPDEEAAA